MEIWTTTEAGVVTLIQTPACKRHLGQILLSPPGITLSLYNPSFVHLWSRISESWCSTRSQGPLSLVGCYNIHQEDQRSDLSMFLSDLRLLEVSQLRANMMEASDRERQHNSKSARTHLLTHNATKKHFFKNLSAAAWTHLMGASEVITLKMYDAFFSLHL